MRLGVVVLVMLIGMCGGSGNNDNDNTNDDYINNTNTNYHYYHYHYKLHTIDIQSGAYKVIIFVLNASLCSLVCK